MNALIAAFGVAIVAASVFGVLRPRSLTGWMASLAPLRLLTIGVIMRLAFGLLLVFGAPGTRYPTTVFALGMIALAAAAALPMLGTERLARFVGWWSERPSAMVRGWCVAGVAFGAFMVFAVR